MAVHPSFSVTFSSQIIIQLGQIRIVDRLDVSNKNI
jgi:hypothetical protein